MAIMSLEELYERYIKTLSAEERLRLMTMTAQDLSASPDSALGVRSFTHQSQW